MSKRRRTAAVNQWNREDVSYCKCSDVAYTHSHCPCQECNGRAVSRSTEYRHWKIAQAQYSSISTDSTDEELDSDDIDPQGSDSHNSGGQSSVAGGGSDKGGGNGGGDDGNNGACADGGSTSRDSIDINDPGTGGGGSGDAGSSNGGYTHGGGGGGDGSNNSGDDGSHTEDNGGGAENDMKSDLIEAIIKAMMINDDVNGSRQSFMNILNYGKDLYLKGKADRMELEQMWPKSWQNAIHLLEKEGYKNPKDLFICLNNCHPCVFDTMESPDSKCRFCENKASSCIKYSYLPLKDKIIRWCNDKEFCHMMTSHWKEKDHWIQVDGGYSIKKEIWDGSRFCELSWFWDPCSKWILPTFCLFCKHVISAIEIENQLPSSCSVEDIIAENECITLMLECQQCFNKFNYCVQVASGDPRNIALIGHWDGWQPFSTSAKHSSGS
jgi:hypothetical protein